MVQRARFFSALFLALFLSQSLTAQVVRSGPMVGYSEMREVMLWVQLWKSSEVYIRYLDVETNEDFVTNTVRTEKKGAFTAHLLADRVKPGRKYKGELFVDGKKVNLKYPLEFQSQVLWQYRTDPPNFKFVTGSCAFINDPAYDRPGTPYGGGYEIFDHIAKQDADFMVWLGDNNYLREADYGTRTGIMHRYSYARSKAEVQPLLGSMHHYAIWDDHDYGPNNSDRSYQHKDITLEAFQLFWANPSYGINGNGGITSRFTWADCDFFLLDNRYFRTPNDRVTGENTMLGKDQVEWLIDGLKMSRAPFKFVCIGGMVLSSLAEYENYSKTHPEERDYIMETIQKEKIKGVVFLDGDRHHTELSYWKPDGGVAVYDLTCSPLTSGAYDTGDEDNKYLVKGTTVGQRNFAVIEVTGADGERTLKMTLIDRENKVQWTREISEKEWE